MIEFAVMKMTSSFAFQGLPGGIPVWLAVVLSAATLLFGSGGVYAWFKLGAEKGQITVNAAQGAVIVHAGVLKDLQEQYERVTDELAQLRMETVALETQHEKCRELTHELQLSITFMHRDLDRHGRMAELARRKSHTAINAMASYELLIDQLHNKLTENNILVPIELKSYDLRKSLRDEMNRLEDMESMITEQVVKKESPPPTIG